MTLEADNSVNGAISTDCSLTISNRAALLRLYNQSEKLPDPHRRCLCTIPSIPWNAKTHAWREKKKNWRKVQHCSTQVLQPASLLPACPFCSTHTHSNQMKTIRMALALPPRRYNKTRELVYRRHHPTPTSARPFLHMPTAQAV